VKGKGALVTKFIVRVCKSSMGNLL